MTDDRAPPGDADRGDYVRRLIASRCPELGPDDIALLAEPRPMTRASIQIADKVLAVLEAREQRMLALESASAA